MPVRHMKKVSLYHLLRLITQLARILPTRRLIIALPMFLVMLFVLFFMVLCIATGRV